MKYLEYIKPKRQQVSGCQGLEEEAKESDYLMGTGFPFGVMKMFGK